MNTYLQAGVSGVMTGGLYAVMALGLSLTWGLLKVINLAHFALILGSAYVTYQVTTSTGVDPLLSALIVVPCMFVVGVAIQWVIDRFQVDEFNSLLLSFGLFIIAIQLINNIWSADFRQIDAAENPYATRAFFIGDIAFPVPQLIALGAALVLARRDVLRAPPHLLRQGAARARVRPRDRRRVRRRPSADRDADRRPRVGDGRRSRAC